MTVTSSSPRLLSLGTQLLALAAGVGLLYFGRDFFVTLIVSTVLAFILDPAVVLVMKLRVPRAAATPIIIGVAFAGIYLLGVLAWTQVRTIAEDFPAYATRVSDLIDKSNTELDHFEKETIERVVPQSLREQEQQIEQKPQEMRARRRRSGSAITPPTTTTPSVQEVRIRPEPKPLITTLYVYASRYFHLMVMASFVPFLVYFMLSWRDRIERSFLQLFPGAQRPTVQRSVFGIADSTRAYVLGNFLLWVLVGSVSAAMFFFLAVPYWAVVGFVSGFFSLLPYVGLPLSILPPAAAALMIPNKFKIVLLIIGLTSALHVIAMNFLYAKIIGKRVRLNPLIVTISLLFWGSVWGGVGLILAIPITAALKAVCDNVESLHGYGELLGD